MNKNYSPEFIMRHKKLLEKIVRLEAPLKELLKQDEVGFGETITPGYLVILTKEDFEHILMRFLNHELTQKQVYEWADDVMARDHIGFEEQFAENIGGLLGYLINGYEIGHPLTDDDARKYLKMLSE